MACAVSLSPHARVCLALLGVIAVGLGGCADRVSAAKGPPPILLISMDTLRADRLGAYGNPDGLTPNLDAFAREAIVFDRAYSQAVQTAPSHASVFTGRYPTEQTSPDNQTVLVPEHPTLAGMLGVYGYQTAAFVAGGDLSPHRKLTQGFGTYETSEDFGSLYHTFPRALAWLDTAVPTQPWFLFVHGYDCHSIYLKPTPYGYLHADLGWTGEAAMAVQTATERIIDGHIYPNLDGLLRADNGLLRARSPENRERVQELLQGGESPVAVVKEDLTYIRGVYNGAVSYADAMFGKFLAGLEQRGTLDSAVIVVMSDHGEQLGERGIFGHCCGLGDEETQSVLMVRLPGGAHGGRHVRPFVELVDLLPTLAEIAGARAPAGIAGRSLVGALEEREFEGRAYSHSQGNVRMRIVSVRGEEGRLTYAGMPATGRYLADVVEVARLDGPGFEGTESLAARATLRTELVRWLRTLEAGPDVTAEPIPAGLKKSLRDHGYFDVTP